MNPAFWRQWHRWIAFPATLFLLWAGTTGVILAATEFFGEEEERREALRTVVSTVTATGGAEVAQADLSRALAAVAAAAGGAPIDKVTLEFKGERTVSVFTGKPGGGEDRKFVVDALSGNVRQIEDYADKPFINRLHSGEAIGDGGLVFAMIWGGTLVWLTVSGFIIYWRMRRREATGLQRIFW